MTSWTSIQVAQGLMAGVGLAAACAAVKDASADRRVARTANQIVVAGERLLQAWFMAVVAGFLLQANAINVRRAQTGVDVSWEEWSTWWWLINGTGIRLMVFAQAVIRVYGRRRLRSFIMR